MLKTSIRMASPIWKFWASFYEEKPPKLLGRLLAASNTTIKRSANLLTGQKMWVNPWDKVGGAIYKGGCFEPETVNYVRNFLQPGMTFLDIGANIGQYSLIASLQVGKLGKVIAFEPHPTVRADLLNHIAINRCDNVSTFPVALSDRKGEARLFEGFRDNQGAHSLAQTYNTSSSTLTVKTERMDDLLAGIERIDLIKIDVEGAELLVLRGGEKTITRTRPTIIMEVSDHFTKYFDYRTEDLIEWLERHRYRIMLINKSGDLVPYHRETIVDNIVCIPA